MRISALIVLLLSCLFLGNCKPKESMDSLKIAAPSSFRAVLTDLIAEFQTIHRIKIFTDFGSSGANARRVVLGSDVGVYISAHKEWIDYVQNHQVHFKNVEGPFCSNQLVAVVPSEHNSSNTNWVDRLRSLNEEDRIAVGDTMHVPAGKYANQTFKSKNLTNDVGQKLLLTKDVQSALRLAELNEVKMAFVYGTDAILSRHVRILDSIPMNLHDPIQYYGIADENAELALKFLSFLSSGKAIKIFEKHSFIPVITKK